MSGIRPYERTVARFYGLPLTRRERDKQSAKMRRRTLGEPPAPFVVTQFPPPSRPSWWRRFVSWLVSLVTTAS